MCSHKLNLTKVPLINAIFAWAEDRVPISSISFGGIVDKLVDTMHLPFVRSVQLHPLSIHLSQKSIETIITKN